MEGILALLVPFGSFLMIFGIVYVQRTARNREVLAAIEKGMDPGFLKEENYLSKKYNSLKSGFLFVGVAIGLLMGYLLTEISNIDPTLSYIALSFLFGGLALIIAQERIAKMDKEAEDTSDRIL